MKSFKSSRRRFLACASTSAIALLASARAFSAAERKCEQNLRAIHEAVMAYRRAHGTLPANLSAVSRAGLIDQRLLVCPLHEAAGTNRLRQKDLVNDLPADPLTLYKWEWMPSLMDHHERQRLMGAGDWVPMVRCDEHSDDQGNNHLNLGIGGGIYPSGVNWEYRVRHIVPYPYLSALALIKAGKLIPLRERIPPRSREAGSTQVDLGAAFNGALNDPWIEGYPGEEAPEILTLGGADRIWRHAGIAFEIRGVAQVEGSGAVAFHNSIETREPQEARYPARIRPLKLDVESTRLHVLCGVILDQPAGTAAARLTVVDHRGERKTLVLKHGVHVTHAAGLQESEEVSVAWSRVKREDLHYAVRSLSHVIWPLGGNVRITGLEFEATDSASSPFLIALTAE